MTQPVNPEAQSLFDQIEAPVLTEAARRALFEAPDRGIENPLGIPRFPSFQQDWLPYGGLANMDNFYRYFCSDVFAQQARKLGEHFLRYELLYPEDMGLLQVFSDEFLDEGGPTGNISLAKEAVYWRAYENLASLVDVNDRSVRQVSDFQNSVSAARYLTR